MRKTLPMRRPLLAFFLGKAPELECRPGGPCLAPCPWELGTVWPERQDRQSTPPDPQPCARQTSKWLL